MNLKRLDIRIIRLFLFYVTYSYLYKYCCIVLHRLMQRIQCSSVITLDENGVKIKYNYISSYFDMIVLKII